HAPGPTGARGTSRSGGQRAFVLGPNPAPAEPGRDGGAHNPAGARWGGVGPVLGGGPAGGVRGGSSLQGFRASFEAVGYASA
ncbi:hypothetical protein ABTF40_19400, partial [Acinetobacter baumannii]